MTISSRNLIAALAIIGTPWLVASAHAVTITSPLMLKTAMSPATETVPASAAIPLGFIANELITNAAKYGRGQIAVALKAVPEHG